MWPVREHQRLRIRASAAQVQDWPHVLAVAERHRVVGLVWRALSLAQCSVPAATAVPFQRAAMGAARQAMSLAIESSQLGRKLQAQGIDALFLKGVTVAILAYGEAALRHAKDIDLLVLEPRLEEAIALLHAAGYRPGFDLDKVTPERRTLWFRYAKSMDWLHPVTGVQLELHWRLTDLSMMQHEPEPGDLQSVRVAPNCELATLAGDVLLAYLCVHGGAHGWMRLKWLADVRALLPEDPAACEATYRRLLAMGAGRAAGQALLLCHDLLDLPLSAALVRELESHTMLRVLRDAALRLLARGGEVQEVNDLRFGTTSVYLSRLLLGRGLRALGSELRTWGYRPDELLTTKLPRPLFFAFPLVRAGSWLVSRLRHGGRSAPFAH